MSDAPADRDQPPAWPIRGLIEGFYGPPWSWDERLEVMRWCHDRGMTHYLYAPKDDPLHRERWREPFGADALAGFDALVGAGTLEVGLGISPGLSIDVRSSDDRAALHAKVDQLVERGVGLIALLLDDIPSRPGLGEEHAELTARLREHLDGRAGLVLTPTEYTGTRPSAYLDALASGVPDDVPIGWTGPTVVCDELTVADATARADALGGRPPFVWDNYPVNDAVMADRLFVGPLRGREPGLAGVCSGYAANPMVQPRASRLPLASTAAYLRGADPEAVWVDEAGPLRTFAEACDGDRPRRLVEDALAEGVPREALDRLEAWLRDARSCGAPGLEDEVGAWLEQVHQEAGLGVLAVRALRALAGDPDDPPPRQPAGVLAMAIAAQWPAVRRGGPSVMGARCATRPVVGQGDVHDWVFRSSSVTEGENAIDRLVRETLRRADGAPLADTGLG